MWKAMNIMFLKVQPNLLGRPDAPDIIFEFVDWAEEAANGAEIGASQQILRDMGYRIFYFNEPEVK